MSRPLARRGAPQAVANHSILPMKITNTTNARRRPDFHQGPVSGESGVRTQSGTVIADQSGAQPAAPAQQSPAAEEVTISCYENKVPCFVEAELDQLYGHLNSSLSHYGVRRKANEASTYVARRGGEAIAILLFKRTKRKVSVINEMIHIAPAELERFAAFIFSNYPSVAVISFSLIGKEIGGLPYPTHQYDGSEDIVLTLPATPEAYLEALSSKMRRNIRHYLRTIARDHPTFRCETTFGNDINEQQLHDLINLKKLNIGAKNLKFGIDAEEIAWLARQAQISGLLTVTLIDDRVCGGSISLRVKDNFFGQIVSYDPLYQKYSLGILCCYLTVCDQIAMGAKESHLCWGRYQYKYKLSGVQRDMASLDLYRGRGAYYRNVGVVLAKAGKTFLQESKNRLLDMEHEEGTASSIGATLVRTLRKIKRFRIAA